MTRVPAFHLDCGVCVVRSWRQDDLGSLLRYADNSRVAANMRDRFPHPYTEVDGRAWLALTAGEMGDTNWAIEVGGEAAGGIGLMPQADINAGTAEIGYWLGEPFWGCGIATAAVLTVTNYALTVMGYRRLYATALSHNAASRRVLEKAGYRFEGLMRASAIKHGRVLDQALYGVVRDDLASRP
jgi:[ribosomal protein S5]-alanine N-acetyltransferase